MVPGARCSFRAHFAISTARINGNTTLSRGTSSVYLVPNGYQTIDAATGARQNSHFLLRMFVPPPPLPFLPTRYCNITATSPPTTRGQVRVGQRMATRNPCIRSSLLPSLHGALRLVLLRMDYLTIPNTIFMVAQVEPGETGVATLFDPRDTVREQQGIIQHGSHLNTDRAKQQTAPS